jgi:hypothetical protein
LSIQRHSLVSYCSTLTFLHLPLSSNILAQNTSLSIFLKAQRKWLSAMHFPGRCLKNFVSVLLFAVSHTLAQDTAPQTIYGLSIFSDQKPCAQECFTAGFKDCYDDILASAIGCQYTACDGNPDFGAPNSCYCRPDLQSAAELYLTSCVGSACTIGDSSIDMSSAGSIYNNYCSSQGFLADVAATTTEDGVQGTTTGYVTVYRSSGI